MINVEQIPPTRQTHPFKLLNYEQLFPTINCLQCFTYWWIMLRDLFKALLDVWKMETIHHNQHLNPLTTRGTLCNKDNKSLDQNKFRAHGYAVYLVGECVINIQEMWRVARCEIMNNVDSKGLPDFQQILPTGRSVNRWRSASKCWSESAARARGCDRRRWQMRRSWGPRPNGSEGCWGSWTRCWQPPSASLSPARRPDSFARAEAQLFGSMERTRSASLGGRVSAGIEAWLLHRHLRGCRTWIRGLKLTFMFCHIGTRNKSRPNPFLTANFQINFNAFHESLIQTVIPRCNETQEPLSLI